MNNRFRESFQTIRVNELSFTIFEYRGRVQSIRNKGVLFEAFNRKASIKAISGIIFSDKDPLYKSYFINEPKQV